MGSLSVPRPERTVIGGSLEIPRMINGLWQLAGGHDQDVNIATAAEALERLLPTGLDGFDMADHYGDSELIIGHHFKHSAAPITAFTKWCPTKASASFDDVEAAVTLASARMSSPQIDLLQYHSWDYSDGTLLPHMAHLRRLQESGKIHLLGLTNTDAAHLEFLCTSGFSIATNQVSCSVIDRRVVRGRLSSVCAAYGVRILAYGTLLGGFLSEKWLGAPEPTDLETHNWSLKKYLRFIHAAGGWDVFQGVLQALATVAARHNVPIAAIATRFVLDLPAVAAVIVGTRLSADSHKYVSSNLAAFSITLSDADRALVALAQEKLTDIPGDCGDEYRRAPFLTATGDLSDHVEQRTDLGIEEAVNQGSRIEVSSGSQWESIAGYCRAVRTGNTIRVSGTTANSNVAGIAVVGEGSARAQTVAALDIIEQALKKLGAGLADVVRTRLMIRNEEDAKEVCEAHGWAFGCVGVRPANTMVVAGLIGQEYLVEVEAEAEIGCGNSRPLRI